MPIPRPCIVADMVVDTSWGIRRNRFYFEADIPPAGITDLEAMMNRLMAVYCPLFITKMTSQCKILRFEGRWYGAGTTGWEGNSTVSAETGTNAAVTPGSTSEAEGEADILTDTLPDEVSVIIQKRTGNTGPSQMGRWFFTGFSEKLNNHGVIAVNWIAGLKAIADLLSTDVTVTGAFSTVMHPRHYNQKANSLMPITKCYVLKTLGTRKDRRRPLALERA